MQSLQGWADVRPLGKRAPLLFLQVAMLGGDGEGSALFVSLCFSRGVADGPPHKTTRKTET